MKTFLRSLSALVLAFASLSADAQKIAVLSDIHVSPGNANEQKLREAVAEINSAPYDIVMLLGDLSNEGSDAELRNVKTILDSIRHPIYVIPGNHETTWSQSATVTFPAIFGNDRFVAEADSTIIIGIASGPYMKMGDGHIKTEDLAWLRNTLRERVTPGKKVLSVNHYPLNQDLDNFAEYAATLAEFPVMLHVNGHYHAWQPYTAGNIPGTLPGAMLRALDMRSGDYGYSVIDITPDWIHIYNKEIGKAARPKFAFPVATSYKPVAYELAKWEQPEGFKVDKVWADDASVFSRIALDDTNMYFGNSLGVLKAVDKNTGKQAWSCPAGPAVFARPMVMNGARVAFPTPLGLKVFDKDGKKSRDIPTKGAPYVADGLKTPRGWAQGGYKRMEMRHPASGKLIWEYDSLFNYCQAEPATDGRVLIFGAWDTNLRCLDLKTGRLRWVWNSGSPNNLFSPGNVVPVIAGDKVIIVAPDRFMTAIDLATGRTLWRDNSHRYRESLGASPDHKRVYAKTMDGELVAVDATAPQFKELWTLDMGLGYEHAPCIVLEHDGIVYAGSRRGLVTAVDPSAPRVLWQLPLGTSEINGFEIDPATGHVYLSLVEGTIFRIQKTEQ